MLNLLNGYSVFTNYHSKIITFKQNRDTILVVLPRIFLEYCKQLTNQLWPMGQEKFCLVWEHGIGLNKFHRMRFPYTNKQGYLCLLLPRPARGSCSHRR